MNNNQNFHVKVKKFTWKNYILIIREKDFQLKKEKSKKIRYNYIFINECSCI